MASDSEAFAASLPPNVIVLLCERNPEVVAYVHSKIRGLDPIDIAQMLGAMWRTLQNAQETIRSQVEQNQGPEAAALFTEAVEVAKAMPTAQENCRIIDRKPPS